MTEDRSVGQSRDDKSRDHLTGKMDPWSLYPWGGREGNKADWVDEFEQLGGLMEDPGVGGQMGEW